MWNPPEENECPDGDGVFDPGTDTLVGEADFMLSVTTGVSSADFVDRNGDNCSYAGNGPDHTRHCSLDSSLPCAINSDCPSGTGTCVDGALVGSSAPGPCCTVGQTAHIVTAGIAITAGAPLYDLTFEHSIPIVVVACNPWPGPVSCTLTTNMCEE